MLEETPDDLAKLNFFYSANGYIFSLSGKGNATLTGLSPVITIIISLIIYSVVPGMVLSIGLILAIIAIFLLSE